MTQENQLSDILSQPFAPILLLGFAGGIAGAFIGGPVWAGILLLAGMVLGGVIMYKTPKKKEEPKNPKNTVIDAVYSDRRKIQ